MAALGYAISVQRLEQLEYGGKRLNVRGQQRLRDIAAALRAIAAEQGWSSGLVERELADGALFPQLFPAGSAGAGEPVEQESTEPALIHATVLFIDLMNSVALSTALSVWEYNDLVNDYQAVLREVLEAISGTYPVGEFYLGGDQLAAFFYTPGDAQLREEVDALRSGAAPDPQRAAELEAQLTRSRDRALYGALRCAVAVKNAWIAHPRNVLRVQTDQPVLDVGIGINTGNVVLQQRGDRGLRIEGFAINIAKRVEGFARHGRYCRIMLSRSAFEVFRGIVVEETMLKQRAFFESYAPGEGTLKGLPPGTEVFELKFFHRLAGFTISEEEITLQRQIFESDPTNIWAYTNLVNFYLFSHGDLTTARQIAQKALYCNPHNEKIYYDLAVVHQELGELDLAREYAFQCLRLNEQMDIAFQLIAEVDLARGADPSSVISYVNHAIALSPRSAALHLFLAVQLISLERLDAARKHYEAAREIFPGTDARYPNIAAQFA
jgi:class 3 adenylate cyclase